MTGALAVGGGVIGTGSGVIQLNAKDEKTKQLCATIGDVSLSLNNIPGLVVGTGSYVFTQDLSRSMDYANIAGITAGGASLIRSGTKAYKMQRLFNVEVGQYKTSWNSFTRKLMQGLLELTLKGLRHLTLFPNVSLKKWLKKLHDS